MVTIFLDAGEDEAGNAVYERVVLAGACVFAQRGARQPKGPGIIADDRVTLYLLDTAVQGRAWADPDDFYAMQPARRAQHYTLRGDGRDRVFLGVTRDGTPPPGARTMRVARVSRLEMGSRRAWHVRVELV